MIKQASLIVTLVTSGVSAVVGLLVAFGVGLTAEQMAAIMTAAGFVGVVVGLILWSRTVDRAQVVERLIGETVVAGEANDVVPTGAEVRTLEPRRAIDDEHGGPSE